MRNLRWRRSSCRCCMPTFDAPFLPQLTACDAAPAFGFGVAYMKCSRAAAAGVGALAERRGDYVKFYLGPDERAPKDRLGVPHLLPYAKQRFKVAISARARYKAHSGVSEAHGLLLALKWLLRKRGNFHHRLAFLIDAKAVLGATSKGQILRTCDSRNRASNWGAVDGNQLPLSRHLCAVGAQPSRRAIPWEMASVQPYSQGPEVKHTASPTRPFCHP